MTEPALVIHRRTVSIADFHSFEVPGFVRKILSAANPRNDALRDVALDVWYEVYPTSPHGPTRMVLHIVGTGNPIPPTKIGEHIDTVVTPNGLVWHVYGYTVDTSEDS